MDNNKQIQNVEEQLFELKTQARGLEIKLARLQILRSFETWENDSKKAFRPIVNQMKIVSFRDESYMSMNFKFVAVDFKNVSLQSYETSSVSGKYSENQILKVDVIIGERTLCLFRGDSHSGDSGKGLGVEVLRKVQKAWNLPSVKVVDLLEFVNLFCNSSELDDALYDLECQTK